jgi:hypothetical protein
VNNPLFEEMPTKYRLLGPSAGKDYWRLLWWPELHLRTVQAGVVDVSLKVCRPCAMRSCTAPASRKCSLYPIATKVVDGESQTTMGSLAIKNGDVLRQ